MILEVVRHTNNALVLHYTHSMAIVLSASITKTSETSIESIRLIIIKLPYVSSDTYIHFDQDKTFATSKIGVNYTKRNLKRAKAYNRRKQTTRK